jgi:hypothetical protein
LNPVLLYIAAVVTGVWGIAHLFATKGVVRGFGDLSEDNRRIITMEWSIEGVALISTATFVAAATAVEPGAAVSSAVYVVTIPTLVVLAVVSLFTGSKMAFLPFRLCPVIFGVSAALIAWAAWLCTAHKWRPDDPLLLTCFRGRAMQRDQPLF